MRKAAALAVWLGLAAPVAAAEYRATAPDPGAQLKAMLELYDSICLRTFPDDAGIAAAMAARGAVPLDGAGVRALLHDDPGVGWNLEAAGARIQVTVEAPPYHACAVRAMTPNGIADLGPYRALADGYERPRGPFRALPAVDRMDGVVHSVGGADGRVTAAGDTELLILISGSVTDEALRKQGQTAIEVRFVHQIVMPAGEHSGGPAS